MKSTKYETPKAQIEIIENFCKGCDICVQFCPKKILGIKKFKVVVTGSQCTGCGICETLCPDFAIKIYKKGTK